MGFKFDFAIGDQCPSANTVVVGIGPDKQSSEIDEYRRVEHLTATSGDLEITVPKSWFSGGCEFTIRYSGE